MSARQGNASLRSRWIAVAALTVPVAVAAVAFPIFTAREAAVASPVAAPRQQRGPIEPNLPYDGRLTFARLRYREYTSNGWAYDYPVMERNLLLMMKELTTLKPHFEGSNVHWMDDPELLKYPVAYLSEPGYWLPNESEVEGLRNYIAKGGFLIVDDFRGFREWNNFETHILRVLPGAEIERMTVKHPIFDSFFHLQSIDMFYPYEPTLPAEFFGIYENNDRSKRLVAIINYNNDLGEYMEFSGDPGWWPVNITNDAYKLVINYIVYGLTH